MLLSKAQTIAEWVRAALAPACEQIIIAGSIRRAQPHPNDIEIVCIPKRTPPPTFGQPLPQEPLSEKLLQLEQAGHLILWGKDGPRQKCYMVVLRHEPQNGGGLGIRLDLFIVRPPATWGVILAIRTGPAEYAHWFVTKAENGGGLPNDLRVEHGALWHGDEQIPTPSEEAFFGAIGEKYRQPARRIPRWGARRLSRNAPQVEP